MFTTYKQYTIIFENRDGKIVVTSIIANGNFQCIYGERVYDSLQDVKRDIDTGKYGCH